MRQVQAPSPLPKGTGGYQSICARFLNIGGFQRFLDIAFDNIISDWLTQAASMRALGK